MAIPATALAEDTGVGVGSNEGEKPVVICHTMTPDIDGVVGNGVQVEPEYAEPNQDGTFPVTEDASRDGWQLVKFYVQVGHSNCDQIQMVTIDVDYPDVSLLHEQDLPLFQDRCNTLKFEVHAIRTGVDSWVSEVYYPRTEYYADGTEATVPSPWTVRQLIDNQPTNVVDVNCDNVLGNDNDMSWQSFLPYWTDSRVKYNHEIEYGVDTPEEYAIEQYVTQQSIVLEVEGWMWYHQPGTKYTVETCVQSDEGVMSSKLDDGGKFLNYKRKVGLYTDFDQVVWQTVAPGSAQYNVGDRYLHAVPEKTTIWNNGNAPAEVVLESTKMVLVSNDTVDEPIEGCIYDHPFYGDNLTTKNITSFDAKLYYFNSSNVLTQMGEIDYQADTPTVITNDNQHDSEITVQDNLTGAVLLQQCRPAKIEFSVHPEPGQTTGEYAGILIIKTQAYTGSQSVT
jgi:hypothetical protein